MRMDLIQPFINSADRRPGAGAGVGLFPSRNLSMEEEAYRRKGDCGRGLPHGERD